ncbi:hypothetical protein [Ilumatobacter sp.]|uniref:hypothetical protein n=1 Tax=Ilumatobacter sp. TaxID=1967498 RepID=UPI003752E3B2
MPPLAPAIPHDLIGPAPQPGADVPARQVQRLLADDGLKGRKVPDLLIAALNGGRINWTNYRVPFAPI